MKTNIDEIQKKIDSLFVVYKIPAITKNLPMQNLHEWSSKVAAHFLLEEDDFRQVVTELFWSIAHVQLSLGHTLIALEECEFKDGVKGIALKEENIPNIKMPEIYFWFYVYNSYECIYRCWERINNVLLSVCFSELPLKEKKNRYFPQTVADLKKHSKYKNNPFVEELHEHIKYRKNAADDRNEISHGSSSPMRNMKIEGKTSKVLGLDQLPFIYLDYSCDSLIKELDSLIDKYRRILPAIMSMKNFIDNI